MASSAVSRGDSLSTMHPNDIDILQEVRNTTRSCGIRLSPKDIKFRERTLAVTQGPPPRPAHGYCCPTSVCVS